MQEIQEMQVGSLGREGSSGEGSSSPLQYSCLGNPMDRGAWWATVHGVTGLDMAKRLSMSPAQQGNVTQCSVVT